MLSDPCLVLRPEQSTRIHGWLNPKRTLNFEMICSDPSITVRKCIQAGITQQQLQKLQPDLRVWIEKKNLSFEDVPYMDQWVPKPLHPFEHLNGTVLDILENNYPASLLLKLQIDYATLSSMHMTPEMMKCLHYSLEEWKSLGFNKGALSYFTEKEVQFVFQAPRDVVEMQLEAAGFQGAVTRRTPAH